MKIHNKNMDIIINDKTRSIKKCCEHNKANLKEANLHGADLRGADLREANLREANLWDTKLDKNTIIRQASKWVVIYQNKILSIGCNSGTFDDWEKNGEDWANEDNFTDEQKKEYLKIIEEIKCYK